MLSPSKIVSSRSFFQFLYGQRAFKWGVVIFASFSVAYKRLDSTSQIDQVSATIFPGETHRDSPWGQKTRTSVLVNKLRACRASWVQYFRRDRYCLGFANSATGVLGYQWHRAGRPIAGANESSLTLESVSTDDLGAYYVDVSLGTSQRDAIVVRTKSAFVVDDANPIVKGALEKEVYLDIGDSESVRELINSPRFPNQPDGVTAMDQFEFPG